MFFFVVFEWVNFFFVVDSYIVCEYFFGSVEGYGEVCKRCLYFDFVWVVEVVDEFLNVLVYFFFV